MDRNELESTGDEGFCICLNCHTRVPRQDWITCLERNCPECGAIMVCEGSFYHQFAVELGLAFNGYSLVPPRRLRNTRLKRRRPVALGHGA